MPAQGFQNPTQPAVPTPTAPYAQPDENQLTSYISGALVFDSTVGMTGSLGKWVRELQPLRDNNPLLNAFLKSNIELETQILAELQLLTIIMKDSLGSNIDTDALRQEILNTNTFQ